MKRTDGEVGAFLQANAFRMQSNPTSAEKVLWPFLEKLGFEQQVVIRIDQVRQPYILDFFHRGRMLCIEVDGPIHSKKKGRDGRRDRQLSFRGIRTLRLTNHEVLKEFDSAWAKIMEAIGET